ITRDTKEFSRLVRFAVHGMLQDAMARDAEAIAEKTGGDARNIGDAFDHYVAERDWFRLDPAGRAAHHTHIDPDGDCWQVAQVLVDYEDQNDWELRLEVDLPASREAGAVVMSWVGLGPIG
ncbi:DUF3516 domain-containing protein, partial [Opitutaceae bacterium]|nr:DUF3516 domain-containing protein [Opitutaceae bacterium]